MTLRPSVDLSTRSIGTWGSKGLVGSDRPHRTWDNELVLSKGNGSLRCVRRRLRLWRF